MMVSNGKKIKKVIVLIISKSCQLCSSCISCCTCQAFGTFLFIMEKKYKNYLLFCLNMALEIQIMLICIVPGSFGASIVYLLKKNMDFGSTVGKTLWHKL